MLLLQSLLYEKAIEPFLDNSNTLLASKIKFPKKQKRIQNSLEQIPSPHDGFPSLELFRKEVSSKF